MGEATKDELRDELLTRTRVPSADFSNHAANELSKILISNSTLHTVMLYKPVTRWGEIDVTSLPALLPNVHFETVKNTKDAPFPHGKFDSVIVPLLGFNGDGYRLGHGGGWYDRFLATQPQAIKIGIGFENSLVEFSPEPHDIPMDIIITDKQVRSF